MKDEYTADDFERAIPNPFFEKLNRFTQVALRHESYKVFQEIAEKNGVEPEDIMKQCLDSYATKLQAHP